MPEINSKRNQQSGNRKKRNKSNNSANKSNKKKKKLLPGQTPVNWDSTEEVKDEPPVSKNQCYLISLLVLFFCLFILWAFVPDRQTLHRRAAEKKAQEEYLKKRAEKHEELAKRTSSFHHAVLLNSSAFSIALKEMHEGEFDRIMLVAFDDSTRDAEANPIKVKLFKKCESLAKSMPRKPLFKRYDLEDLPMIILFDCGNPNDPAAENVCKQIIGDNIPNQLIFRTQQQPRQLPSDYKSQKQILEYLFNLMQPAVKYLEELVDAEDFVADDKFLNAVLFGNDDSEHTFEQIADSLRDYARFGRTKNPSVIEAFDLDLKTDLPSMLIWRTFGENPHIFAGNLSHAQSVKEFVMNNFVPIFGEFTPRTSNSYMKRGLPILWIAYNPEQTHIQLSELLATVEGLAHRYLGHLTFTQLDVKSQPQIASNFGLDVDKDDEDEDDNEDEEDEDDDNDDEDSQLPQAFIMNQIAQVHEVIDMDDIEGSIEKVVDTYMRALRAHRGDVLPDLQDDLDDYNDEYEVDDEDDLLEDDEDEDEEEEEDDDEVDLSDLDDDDDEELEDDDSQDKPEL